MNLKEILPTLTKVAPVLATALGTPLAGTALTALLSAFNLDPNTPLQNQQEALVGALKSATADDLLKLKIAEQDYAVKMAELGFKDVESLASISANDRDSARKREEAVRDSTPRNLAYAITFGFFAVLAVLVFVDIPGNIKEALLVMLGTLQTAWISVCTYFYGSTSGSSEKTRLLAKAPAIQ